MISCTKRVIPIKTRKIEHRQWILGIRIRPVTKFQNKLTILSFGSNFPRKGISSIKRIKWAMSLNPPCSNYSRNFSINGLFWLVGLCLPKKGNSNKKRKKNGFCIFELAQVPNFKINWKVWIFGHNLPKKDISSLKQIKWTLPLNSAYWN